MLNSVELIGRLVADPEVRTLEDGQKVSHATLAVIRAFKNQTGEFGVDYIPVTFWYGTALITEQYCFKGDLIFVRGRMVMRKQIINEKNYQFLEIYGERLLFLNSRNKQEMINEDETDLEEVIED